MNVRILKTQNQGPDPKHKKTKVWKMKKNKKVQKCDHRGLVYVHPLLYHHTTIYHIFEWQARLDKKVK